MGPRGLVQRVDQAWHRMRREYALPRGVGLLVAVSGGADSVGLLRLMAAVNGGRFWNWRLVVGHVSHGIRGRPGERDARFVRKLAGALGLRFVERKLRLGMGASEGAAREGRFRALAAMVKQTTCAGVVMGHHADDQAETVVMRILRGTGIEGLGGMGVRSEVEEVTVWRPLLSFRRTELRAWLEEIGQKWVEDETNVEGRYLRNRVRAEVMAVLEAVAPRGVEAIGRLSGIARQAWRFVEGEVESVWKTVLKRQRGRKVELDWSGLRAVDAFLIGEVLRRAIVTVGGSVEDAGWERVRAAVEAVKGRVGAKVVEVGSGVVVRVGGNAKAFITVERPKGR